ncbi:MAG: deoxyribose-phosphate aldolase [Dethiobacter sp.]|jgi:deoxyribose-phosphate aldolase|nr:deoxyribose-phosphate aldolase [Dethiobacter sp.]MBS3989770.1 deoxyribose-phosphate aldolase [Dethiobacter sp.]
MEISRFVAAIDHTLLKSDATGGEIAQLCAEAKRFSFAAVCVNPWHVANAARLLSGSGVAVAAVAGFPLGATTSTVKVFEAGEAVQNGAQEIDLVMNVAALKEGLLSLVSDEIALVRQVTAGAKLKVILETALLKNEEKRIAARLAVESGADMLKTSTGFFGGVTEDDIRLLAEAAPGLGIKASGGIRDAIFALRLLSVGATRLGTSSAVKIIHELEKKQPMY